MTTLRCRTASPPSLPSTGHLDAVVTCARRGLAGTTEQTSIDAATTQLAINFWGTVRVVGADLPTLREQQGERVVMMNLIGGLIGLPFQSLYRASKFALEGDGESLAYEVAPFNVHHTLAEPGNFRTDFTRSRRIVTSPDIDPYRAGCKKSFQNAARRSQRRCANSSGPSRGTCAELCRATSSSLSRYDR